VATLVDSSVIIAGERGILDFAEFLRRDPDESYALSAVSVAELFRGLHRARNAKQRTRREEFLNGVLDMMPVLPFDLDEARVYASVWDRLAGAGTQIADRDLMIAATALARRYTVATLDARSFPKIPGLRVWKL